LPNQRAPVLPDACQNLLEQDQFTVGFSIPLFRWGAGSATEDVAVADQKCAEVSVAYFCVRRLTMYDLWKGGPLGIE
jgi:hypothetical protein